ncbi:MAG: cation:proton antiporter [Sheuella sp.]|nr:cation:proton antiporter [Sheuella sp.]
MTHSLPLITTIAVGFVMALILGLLAERSKVPAIVGYLVAGIIIGPATPGFVADPHIASQLSEIGIMLLMFGVGLHFSPSDLMAVKRIAMTGAFIQMAATTAVGFLVSSLWGWSAASGLIFGLCLACASTVVMLKSLEARDELDSLSGRIAVGWLVVQDLVTVFALVMLPAFAEMLAPASAQPLLAISVWKEVGKTLLQVSAFVAVMLIVGKRVLPYLLWQVAQTGSRELFTLAVITTAIGIAYGASELFNVSFAIGAFFAGTVMRESEFSHRAAEQTLPLRDAFSVLFFVSIGMLVEPAILYEQPLRVMIVFMIVVLINFLAAVAVILLSRYPLRLAFSIGVSLAQIGEFSIILSGLGVTLGLLKKDGMTLILSGVLLSIAFNSFLFKLIEPSLGWLLHRFSFARKLNARLDQTATLPVNTTEKYLEGQVVLVGYGRVGRRIAQALDEQGIPYVIAEQNRELVEVLRTKGIAAVSGNAGEPAVLIQAHIAEAAMLVIATPDTIQVRQMVDTARTLNPGIEVVIRTHTEQESQLLSQDGMGTIFFGEEELAKGMTRHIFQRFTSKTD